MDDLSGRLKAAGCRWAMGIWGPPGVQRPGLLAPPADQPHHLYPLWLQLARLFAPSPND